LLKSATNTSATPVLFHAVKPCGFNTVADRAAPPSPLKEHEPVPTKACTTPLDVTRRTTHPLTSAHTTESDSAAKPFGEFIVAASTWPPLPLVEAVPVPPQDAMVRAIK